MKDGYQTESDERIMVLYQNGDYAAFTELYQRYAKRVYGFIHSKITSLEDSADLTQTVFLKVHHSRSRYSDKYPFVSWVFTITRNILIDHYRKKKDSPLSLEKEWFLVDPSSIKEDENELLTQAKTAIETLNREQRGILSLRFDEGLSFDEISQKLGLSPQTVRKRVSRLLQKLREGRK